MDTISNTNILYLGEFPTTKLIKESHGSIDSLYRDSQAIIEGLRKQENVIVTVFTIPDIASFPKQRLIINKYYDDIDKVTSLTLLNIPYFKQLWIPLSIIYSTIKYIKHCKGVINIICPYMVFHHALAARVLKVLFKNRVRIITVVPDVFFPKKFLSRLLNNYTEYITRKSDAFVLYTAPMSSYLKIEDKQYIVVEGFNSIKNFERPKQKSSVFTVTYAGTLNEKYGIVRLLDAMKYIPESNICLNLFGIGDAVEIIKKYATNDSRIHFMGQVSKDEALIAVYSSNVLVNPRNSSDGEYVQYSFPSKDIEYLATGIPTILCKLPSMPVEYYGHFVDAKDGSAEQLAKAIISVYNMSEEQREMLGNKARIFIHKRMDTKMQGKIILNLINHK